MFWVGAKKFMLKKFMCFFCPLIGSEMPELRAYHSFQNLCPHDRESCWNKLGACSCTVFRAHLSCRLLVPSTTAQSHDRIPLKDFSVGGGAFLLTILFKIITRIKLLFSNYLGCYSYSFGARQELISVTVTALWV